jgi:hypothetical protein
MTPENPCGFEAGCECLSRIERHYSRKSCYYHIVRKESGESAIWLEAPSDLNIAESRIEELTSFWPWENFRAWINKVIR